MQRPQTMILKYLHAFLSQAAWAVAVKADPAESSKHFLLAQAYRALGRTQEAQAEMKVFSKLEESARTKTAERAKELLQEKSKEP